MINEQLGKEVYVIAQVKSKTPNHKANLSDDYQELKMLCEAKNVKRFWRRGLKINKKRPISISFPNGETASFIIKIG